VHRPKAVVRHDDYQRLLVYLIQQAAHVGVHLAVEGQDGILRDIACDGVIRDPYSEGVSTAADPFGCGQTRLEHPSHRTGPAREDLTPESALWKDD